MTLNLNDLLLYCGALVILLLTPGPCMACADRTRPIGRVSSRVAIGRGRCDRRYRVPIDRRIGDFMDIIRL